MNFLPIAASDMDVVICIIAVIGWILSLVVGRKKTGSPSEQPPTEAPPSANPQDELRKFFEEMEKTLKPAEAQPPTLPPPPPRSIRPPAQPKRERPPRRFPALPEQSPAPSSPLTVFTAPTPPTIELPIIASSTVPTVTRLPSAVSMTEGLHDPVTLRKMIVSMEVLGKPVALR